MEKNKHHQWIQGIRISLSTKFHFTVIHRSSPRADEQILNTSISYFYNSHDVNVIAAKLRPTKTRPISFYMIDNLLYKTKVTGATKQMKK